jgi:molybdopterin synthase sulfur carrier subunit
MSVKIRIPAPLRQATDGVADVSFDPESVLGVLDELETRFPGLKGRLRDEDGALRRFINIYVNGEDVRFLQGLTTALKSGDEVSIIPAVAGGRQ